MIVLSNKKISLKKFSVVFKVFANPIFKYYEQSKLSYMLGVWSIIPECLVGIEPHGQYSDSLIHLPTRAP